MRTDKDIRPQIQEILRLFAEKQYAVAERKIDQLRKQLPEQADLLHLKGRSRLMAGDATAAVSWVERAIAKYPQFSDFYLTLGRAKEVLNDIADAEQMYRNAVKTSNGLNIEAVSALIDILLGKGRYEEALELSVSSLVRAPENLRLLFVAGLSSAKLGKLADAQQYYERVIALKPDQAEAHNNLGNILRRTGKRKEALQAYGNALRLSPGYLDAGYNHAAILLDLGRSREAYEAFFGMVEHHPDMAICWGGLAEASLKSAQRKNVLARATEQLKSGGQPLGPLAAISYLMRFTHDYQGNIETVQHWGYKLQSSQASDHIPYLIASDYVISRWLLGQVDGLKGYLQALLVGMKQVTRDLGRTKIFFQLLLRLLEVRGADTEAKNPILTCIGDSHALSVSGTQIEINGRAGSVSSFFLMGTKTFHLGLSTENRFKTGLEIAFKKAGHGLPVLMCVGEIDCRLWEGIIPAWRKGKFQDLEEAIQDQVNAYVDYVCELASKYSLSLWFQGVPAPNLDWQHVPIEDKALLGKTIRLFNQALEKAAGKKGCRYIDTYKLTAGADGVSNKRWHLDAHHLRPDYLQHCLKKYDEEQQVLSLPPLLQELKILLEKGETEQALYLLQSAPDNAPGLAAGWTMLGTAFFQARQLSKAKHSYERATALDFDLADAHNNLGVLQLGENDTSAALTSFEAACRLMPENVDYQRNRAVLLERLGDLTGAEAAYRTAMHLNANDHRPYVLMAQLIKVQGRLEEAADCYRASLRLRPDIPEVHFNLAQTLRLQGKFKDAATSYRAAWQINPDLIDARVNEGRALLAGGYVLAALESAVTSISIQDDQKTRSLCAECLRQPFPLGNIASTHLPKLRKLLTRAIGEAWTRPTYLQSTAVRFIRETCTFKAWNVNQGNSPVSAENEYSFSEQNWQELYSDELMKVALQAAPMPDMVVGQYLSSLRRQFLLGVHAEKKNDLSRTALMCSLAIQCFINEYILPLHQHETFEVDKLAESLDADLKNGNKIDSCVVVCVAMYQPLHRLTNAYKLLEFNWPLVMKKLLILQVAEPMEEQRLRNQIPSITRIENEVSTQVRQQYEENPYPRWFYPAPVGEIIDFSTRIRRSFPFANIEPLRKGEDIDLLIAGCGTGQQSIEAARKHPKAKILAIDLSLSSITYALRKTREFGIGNIEYAQADILQLGSIGRSFDVIESSGVLHHLSDPEQGWRVLLGLLRPGGCMNVGLYSDLARQNVVAARDFIATKGYPESVEGIRACREAMFATTEDAPWKSVCMWADFYSTSACRDLIFHVHEHRFTIPRIKRFLTENNLVFLGFSFEASTLSKYWEHFPEDQSANDLDKWDIFENKFPETFAGMYQFWIQKPLNIPCDLN